MLKKLLYILICIGFGVLSSWRFSYLENTIPDKGGNLISAAAGQFIFLELPFLLFAAYLLLLLLNLSRKHIFVGIYLLFVGEAFKYIR
jgi:hypothetical protein